jgi:hypothetical protein
VSDTNALGGRTLARRAAQRDHAADAHRSGGMAAGRGTGLASIREVRDAILERNGAISIIAEK